MVGGEGSSALEALTASTASLSLDIDSSLPTWFKAEAFASEEFNAVQYVADLKRYVSVFLVPAAAAAAARQPNARPPPTLPALSPVLQVPLETLKSELHAHLGALQNKLVEVGAAPCAAPCNSCNPAVCLRGQGSVLAPQRPYPTPPPP